MMDELKALPILDQDVNRVDPAQIEVSEAEVQEIRAQLSEVQGEAYWARLEELAATAPFQRFLKRWYPSQEARFGPQVGRRGFLRSMGASLAMAGLGACTRQPEEKIVPFATSPEYLIPGKPRYFATSFPYMGDAIGLLVESHMGRPTKVEGNPDHPSSLGATNGFAQAATLGLYDPDRSHSVLSNGQISTWGDFLTALTSQLDGVKPRGGAGLAVLCTDDSSPSLSAQLSALKIGLPNASIQHWSPLHRDNSRQAAERAFGQAVDARYDFTRAKVILSIDSDFLANGPGSVRYARDFAAGRKLRQAHEGAQEHGEAQASAPDVGQMNRLYAVESTSTLTGAMADHRLAMGPREVESFTRALARALGIPVSGPSLGAKEQAYVQVLADDLGSERGSSIVITDENQSAATQELVHRINAQLGNIGSTLDFIERPAMAGIDTSASVDSLANLVQKIEAGEISCLIMLGGNPVYDSPADIDFTKALESIPFRAHLSLYVDETSRLCQWHIPATHFLEDWSDARAFDGTTSVVQPLIAPLYAGRSPLQVIAAILGTAEVKTHDLVQAHWQAEFGQDDAAFQRTWQTALHDGLFQNTRAQAVEVALLGEDELPPYTPPKGMQVAFRQDAATLDGRYANNGWLQELPRPMSRLTWDNAILISTLTAEEADLENGDVIRVISGERTIEGPIWTLDDHPEQCLTLHLGYGRPHAGTMGSDVGFDAYRLRTANAPWAADSVTIEKTGRTADMATIQKEGEQHGRDLARVRTFDRFSKDPHGIFQEGHGEKDLSLYPKYEYNGYAWGMVIDLNACMGCNACMLACQSENNIPVVGKEEIANGREMHWIRIDRYFDKGDEHDREHGTPAGVVHQPVPCMHCENAPCEVVCPVGATTHSDEGLNEMVYNRCVGTRYCSNNCPYKVRHFNFYAYADYETESLKLGNNPDVTVRSRGVMEKCTYCVQRISYARIDAKKGKRVIQDGEVKTACQQVCPTQAIVFGDINDEQSVVSADREQPQHYGMLDAELATRPRTTYLAKFKNLNPAWEAV